MIILDASVVIKWFSEEEYTEKALELRERIRYGEEQVIEPDLLLYELANALKHNQHFEVQDVRDALTSVFDMNIDIVTPLPDIIDVAIKLAFEHTITVYDAFYIALAQETGLILITADKKLYERVPSLEFVKFIGEL
jgi:predicted nucleic acid-binding protein